MPHLDGDGGRKRVLADHYKMSAQQYANMLAYLGLYVENKQMCNNC